MNISETTTTLVLALTIGFLPECIYGSQKANKKTSDTQNTRQYWVAPLDKIAYPAISTLSEGKFRKTIPLEAKTDQAYKVARLEAFGQVALTGNLPSVVSPAQVRCALDCLQTMAG